MTDTTSAIPSPQEPVVDRYRKWSPVWYPWIKRVLETLRSQADSLFTIQESVDTANGRWSLDITENGRVRGSIKIDASEALSSFAILADKFIVVHPAANGTTIQAFIIGQVNGVNTVGLNGNLIIDGTIFARHLDVESLSAIAADIGEVTAGVLKSADEKFVIDLNNKTLTIET